MCLKVMVMELKEKYALAMGEDGQILRIHIKDGMQVGDCIYILEEDLYQKEEQDASTEPVVIPFREREQHEKKKHRTIWKQMTAMVAAAAMLMAVFSWSLRPETVYAMVTVDGEKNLEFTIDKNHVVQDANSHDGSISEVQTEKLVGQQIEAVEGYFDHGGSSKETAVVGYAMHKDATKAEKEELHRKLEEIFGTDGVVYIHGDEKDMEEAKKAQKSLGLYLTEQAIHQDEMHKIMNDVSEAEKWELLKNHSVLMEDEKTRDTIEREWEDHEAEERKEKKEREEAEKYKEEKEKKEKEQKEKEEEAASEREESEENEYKAPESGGKQEDKEESEQDTPSYEPPQYEEPKYEPPKNEPQEEYEPPEADSGDGESEGYEVED